MSDLILLGFISKAFGLKGAVHIKLINDQSEALQLHSQVTLKFGSGAERVLTVCELLSGARVYFKEISDRNEAEKLQGAQLYIKRADLPKLLDNEFYIADLIGADIVLKNREKVGVLIGFSSNNAQLLLEIQTSQGHKALVPFVPAIVIDIDEENNIITLDPPIGLLEPLDKL
jgi:16S rRNA processing protein RimM